MGNIDNGTSLFCQQKIRIVLIRKSDSRILGLESVHICARLVHSLITLQNFVKYCAPDHTVMPKAIQRKTIPMLWKSTLKYR